MRVAMDTESGATCELLVDIWEKPLFHPLYLSAPVGPLLGMLFYEVFNGIC